MSESPLPCIRITLPPMTTWEALDLLAVLERMQDAIRLSFDDQMHAYSTREHQSPRAPAPPSADPEADQDLDL